MVCQLLSIRERGDQYGVHALDAAVDALTKMIIKSVLPGSKVAKLKLTIFGVVLPGDGPAALDVARDIVRLADHNP